MRNLLLASVAGGPQGKRIHIGMRTVSVEWFLSHRVPCGRTSWQCWNFEVTPCFASGASSPSQISRALAVACADALLRRRQAGLAPIQGTITSLEGLDEGNTCSNKNAEQVRRFLEGTQVSMASLSWVSAFAMVFSR